MVVKFGVKISKPMTQHFLLSAKARTLSLKAVFSMGEDKAYETFRQMRWPETECEGVCPRCGCVETYDIATRRLEHRAFNRTDIRNPAGHGNRPSPLSTSNENESVAALGYQRQSGRFCGSQVCGYAGDAFDRGR